MMQAVLNIDSSGIFYDTIRFTRVAFRASKSSLGRLRLYGLPD
jgi:hypothetical protein